MNHKLAFPMSTGESLKQNAAVCAIAVISDNDTPYAISHQGCRGFMHLFA
jgi:hypothetical protein